MSATMKRIPSNRMPAFVPRRMGVIGWILVGLVGAGLIFVGIWEPWIALVIGLVILLAAGISWPLSLSENHRQQRMQADRQAESLCTFARSFDCRTTDTWIVRAVY